MTRIRTLVSPFGISETNVRSILSRMHSKRILEIRKEGRCAYYRIGGRGSRIGTNVSRHFREPDWQDWDGSYWTAAFSSDRAENRYRIRKKLTAYRLRPLYPGLWIRPYNPDERLDEVFAAGPQGGEMDLMLGSFARPISSGRISRLYDLPATAETLRTAIHEAERSIKHSANLSPESAFVERITMGDFLVKSLSADPLLPPVLLPADWPGSSLRKMFGRWNELLQRQSAAFVEKAVNQ